MRCGLSTDVGSWPLASFRGNAAIGRFSNRPFGVKRFRTIHRHGIGVTRGRVLLYGIGTRLFHHGIRERGGTIFRTALPMAGPSDRADSPHPSSREGHHSTAGWSSSFLLLRLMLYHHAAGTASRVHRNSVPSTQMRCRITANRRASATIAFFLPRRLATCIAQALSHDHRVERTSMLWAAS